MAVRMALLLSGVLALAPAGAQDLDRDGVLKRLKTKIQSVEHLALNPAVVFAAREQNREALSQEEINRRDVEWKAAVGGAQGPQEYSAVPLVHTATNNKVARLLAFHVVRNNAFNEAFLTDKRGANVAAFPPTSDYWQGDEDKFTEAFAGGSGQLFIGPVEQDDSTGVYAVQVSAPVVDNGVTVGVLVVGITLDYLQSVSAN